MTEALKPSCDRKTKFAANQKNALGLMPGDEGTCPNCTKGPKGCWGQLPGRIVHNCYVDKLLRCYKGIRGILEHNTKLLKGATLQKMISLLDAEFKRFKAEEIRRVERAKVGVPQLHYRLHWSGDVFNSTYASALAVAMNMNPDIHFWTYTRSFWSVAELLTAKNLMLYLSLDPENYEDGLRAYFANGGPGNKQLQVCYMNDVDDFNAKMQEARPTLEADRMLRKIIGANPGPEIPALLKISPCPVDTDVMDLEFGCMTCRKCTDVGCGKGIWFKT